MQLEKTNQMNALFDFYGPLLTEKQKEYVQLYYADDYSLGEIAEEFEVSRQAIYDNIKRTEKSLLEYEEKLHLLNNFILLNNKIEMLEKYTMDKYKEDETLKALIKQLKQNK